MASKLYYIRALVASEVAIEEGDDAEELDEAIKGGEDAILDLLDEYDTGAELRLTSEEIVGIEIVSADGDVILRRGQQIPGIIRP